MEGGGELEGGLWNEGPPELPKRGALLKVGGEKGAKPKEVDCGGLLGPLNPCERPKVCADVLRDAPPCCPPFGPAPLATPSCDCPP